MRNSNNTNTGTIFLVSHYNRERLFSFLSAETLLDPSSGKHIQFPQEYDDVIGSCNGIYCLKHRFMINGFIDLLLWNPATREVKVVPCSDVPKPPNYARIWNNQYGFGFDPKTNDFKVVRLLLIQLKGSTRYDNLIDFITQIELYSFRTDSWRQLHDVDDVIFPRDDIYNSALNVYMNGRYHWWVNSSARRLVNKNYSILSFDMSDEEFRTLPFPDLFDEYYLRERYSGNISVLNESMTSMFFPYQKGEKCYDIWVMHEYGVKESWTKEYVVGPIYGVDRPLAFWKNNGGLFLTNQNGHLVLYDPTDHETKDLQMNGCTRYLCDKYLYVLIYVESLVSLKGRPELDKGIVRVDIA